MLYVLSYFDRKIRRKPFILTFYGGIEIILRDFESREGSCCFKVRLYKQNIASPNVFYCVQIMLCFFFSSIPFPVLAVVFVLATFANNKPKREKISLKGARE